MASGTPRSPAMPPDGSGFDAGAPGAAGFAAGIDAAAPTAGFAADAPAAATPASTPSPAGLWRRVRHNKAVIVGGGLLLAILFVALFAPWLSPHDPYAQDLVNRTVPPVWYEGGSWLHPLGVWAAERRPGDCRGGAWSIAAAAALQVSCGDGRRRCLQAQNRQIGGILHFKLPASSPFASGSAPDTRASTPR